jgi:formate dehydrogenase major subunit
MNPEIDNLKKIKVSVNGRELEVFSGMSILQSLIQEKIYIPHLCYDIRLVKSNGNCGLCVVDLNNGERDVKACQTPIQEGMIINTSTPKIEAYRKIRLEQLLSDHNADCVAPCVQTCPANIDIQIYLRHVGIGNYEGALRVIKERNPFPVVCGRVCPHPCEAQCRRNLVDSPVAINYVKRFVADLDLKNDPYIPEKAAPTGKRIAVVGAGPSGLSAAYYSAIYGHEVTVFERQPEAGGMMRYGIPEYRLPKKTLDKEIDVIKKLGVKILTEKALGVNIRLEDLQKDFDAVYLGIGSWHATPLQIEGDQAKGVWLGIQYLEQVIKGINIELGENVVVIGGGNTAIDCARTALRKGAKKVKLIYRRSQEEMPAEPYEVEEALKEGVEMIFLTAPSKIEFDNTGDRAVRKVHCIKMELGEPDRSGRRRPIPVEGSEFSIEASTVIGAIGQSTNTQFLWNDLPVQLSKWGDIQIHGKTMQTSAEKVFAGGDCVTGPATVIQGVGAGRRAAEAINDFIEKGYVKEKGEDYSCSRGSLEDLPKFEFEDKPKIPRAKMPEIEIEKRRNNFNEVELGLNEKQAISEAQRCLKCGCTDRYICELRHEATKHDIKHLEHIGNLPYLPIAEDHPFIVRDHNKCISCGRCVAACAEIEGPDVLGLYIKNGKLLIGTKSGYPLEETDCVSCGQCVNACPCGALHYKRERNIVFRAINDPKKIVVGFVAPAVRSVVAAHFGIAPENTSAFMAGALKKLGFDKVFDFVFAADLTIVEETTEFLKRFTTKKNLPHMTSCCPGWVNFVERRYPELIPNLSSCKSPQQMMGAVMKNHFIKWAGLEDRKEDVFVVSIVPCLAKKYEAARPEFAPEGIRDVDAVLTSIEVFEMLDFQGIKGKDVIPSEFDDPYKLVSGAGILFGTSGGVAEASLRMAAEKITGKSIDNRLDFDEVRGLYGVKEANVDIEGTKVRVAVISGLKNAEPIIEKMRQGIDVGYDLIEVMACPGGCIAGAGHPVPEDIMELKDRQNVLINIDKSSKLRKSQENPDILRLYKDFFGEANSEIAHKLLHTHYLSKKHEQVCTDHRFMSDSTYKTHNIQVCTCDECVKKGSKEVFLDTEYMIKEYKLDNFVTISTIKLKENHSGSGIYATFDHKLIDHKKLKDLNSLLREK